MDMAAKFIGKAKLYAPPSFWILNGTEEWGCGPGKFGDLFVPDTIYFLNVKAACQIHDYMYTIGKDDEDKWFADVSFLTNLNTIIEAYSAPLMLPLRRMRAMKYFSAVRDFGKNSFYSGKEKP